MRACDQSPIFSTGGKFRPDYGLLLELHALTLVARSYALLSRVTDFRSLIAMIEAVKPCNTIERGCGSLFFINNLQHKTYYPRRP